MQCSARIESFCSLLFFTISLHLIVFGCVCVCFFLIHFKEHFKLANGGHTGSPVNCSPLSTLSY